MTQGQFDFENVCAVDPNINPDDKPRVRGQCLKVLERLMIGPASNFELYEICLRPAARVHDLNRHGYSISSKRIRDAEWLYTLETAK